MIEKALMEYLTSITDLNNMVNGRIYYRAAPTIVTMPYIIITNSGGMRRKETQTGFYSSGKDILTLYVDDDDLFRAKEVADRIVGAIENYRGNFQGIQDTHWRCGTTRDLVGFQGTYRQLVTIYVDYRIDTNTPH